MITANFSAYNAYVTDSLYQWDLNQILKVTGLNITTAPEVHFQNSALGKAIVRQATLTDGVVTVDIPNSLLQYPLTIYAFVGIYEGDTFKTIEQIAIPIIPRERPEDYRLQDSDGEIYSFNALENLVRNAVANMDSCIRPESIIDNLESTNDKLPLSANQGRVLNEKVTLKKLSGVVVFSSAYASNAGKTIIVSSLVPLINAEDYSSIDIDTIKIVGTTNTIGASRFTVSGYGTGFMLFSEDEMAIETVAGKAVSFEFTLTE